MIILTLLVYFLLLFAVSIFTTKQSSNSTFYRADKKSPWYMVAFGMIGASISGVTFISVPGMVVKNDMTYLQMCIGFIFGYLVVAFILLPLYYKLNLTSIYTYLGKRLGPKSYLTGAYFFLLSKITGAAISFYVVCMILQRFAFDEMHIPFEVNVIIMVTFIWLYTFRGGIKTLVWTDSFQTFCLLGALLLIIYYVIGNLNMNVSEAITAVSANKMSRMFVFDDWITTQNFWKQFFSGIFVVIVMTGLDQDKMQKNLTCKTLKEAQKDMCSYGISFVPVNLLFLTLGVLLVMLARQHGQSLPAAADDLLPMFAATGKLGETVVILFTLGIVAASFSSADSALTSLTTSYCIDIKKNNSDIKLRHRIHCMMSILFAIVIILFRAINNTSLLDAIYTAVSYTYGPLLGLFAFGLFTKRQTKDDKVPYIAIAAPILSFLISWGIKTTTGYVMGYELLMLNGAITFVGLYLLPAQCTPSAACRILS